MLLIVRIFNAISAKFRTIIKLLTRLSNNCFRKPIRERLFSKYFLNIIWRQRDLVLTHKQQYLVLSAATKGEPA